MIKKTKTTVSYSKCEFFCSFMAMPCPLCGAIVPANTRHTCEKPAAASKKGKS